jgi:predicted phage replisome organizer
MAESKKYYWLKLKRDFFKRHDIRIIEEMPNGKDYILFYLKLLLESIDHEGNLRFSETIPYNEQMLSVVTNTNVDIVRSAMKIFTELNMMDVFDDQTIYMTEVDKLIGSETEWAKKKRLQRGKEDNVPQLSSKCPTEIEKEKEKEKDIEKEGYKEASPSFKPKKSSNPFLDMLKEEGSI